MSTRTGTSLLKRAMLVLLALAMALYFAPGALLAPQKAWAADGGATADSGDTATVNDLAGLQSAINNTSTKTIVVTQAIVLSESVEIDGDNKTIQVEVPYTDETGAVLDSRFSEHGVFTVNSSASVTLKNMTIFGGKASGSTSSAGGIAVNSGILSAENVTVARSCRGLYIASGSKASLTGCNIVRNVCDYGGGVLCAGGTLVMDACSLSENRTTQGNGGGGAIEVNGGGKFYANNTVIANNCSTEIGGAVNVYGTSSGASAYLMNCTVTGNVTTKSKKSGGGVGVNGGSLYAANSIFLDNKYIPGGNGTVEPSDIGLYDASADKMKLCSCLYGTIAGDSSTSSVADSACKQPTDSEDYSVFASYRGDGILFGDSGSTADFSHPQLVSKASGGMHSLYAPLAVTNSPAASGGIDTYFDKSDLNNVEMSYGSSNTALGGLTDVTDTTASKVTTYYEGGSRASGVIGASSTGSSTKTYHTVKLASQPTGGSVSGLTLNGDSKAQDDTVSFTVVPDSGYVIGSVTVKEDGGSGADVTYTPSGNTYSFTMPAHNVTVSVVFTNVQHNVKLGAVPVNGAVTGITATDVPHGVGSTVSFTVTPSSGYEVDEVSACKADDLSIAVTVTKGSGSSYSFTMPDYDVTVTVTFKASAPPAPVTPSTPSHTPDPTPSVTATSPTAYGEAGAISGVTGGMQYKLEGADAWTDVPAGTTQLAGLPAGTYLVRYKGASTMTKVVITPAPTYAVEVKAASGGTAAADKARAMKGETVILSAKTTKGYNLRGWLVAGELVETGSFSMPAANVAVEPVFTPVSELFIAKAKASKKGAALTWNPVEDATSYRVYLAKTGKKLKLAATVEASGASASSADAKAACSYSAKKLKANTIYKLRVHAIGEDGSKIARSTIAYVATGSSSKFANATKVSVSKKNLSLPVGKKDKLSAKTSRLDGKGKKGVEVIDIGNIRFKSSEPAIVKVTKNGTVTALTSGTAYIYAIAPSGASKRIAVKVRTA